MGIDCRSGRSTSGNVVLFYIMLSSGGNCFWRWSSSSSGKIVQFHLDAVGKTLHIMLPSGWDSLILRNYREFQLQSEYNFSRKHLWPQ